MHFGVYIAYLVGLVGFQTQSQYHHIRLSTEVASARFVIFDQIVYHRLYFLECIINTFGSVVIIETAIWTCEAGIHHQNRFISQPKELC